MKTYTTLRSTIAHTSRLQRAAAALAMILMAALGIALMSMLSYGARPTPAVAATPISASVGAPSGSSRT